MNRTIELHDSRIEALVRDGDDLIVVFAHAYIHASTGVPGVNSGVGLSQRAQLRIAGAGGAAQPAAFPWDIYEGALRLGSGAALRVLPVALHYTGPTVLTLTVNDDDDVFHERTITGSGARLTLLGEARVIDSFRGRVS